MTGTRLSGNLLTAALACCVAAGVLTLGEFKGAKSIIQAGVAAGSVWCVCRYPVSAIPIYLIGFYLPTQIFESRAPLPYPHVVLPVAVAAAALLRTPLRAEIPRPGWAAWILLLILSLFTCASSLWGNERVHPTLFLGFALALSAFVMLRSEWDWWLALGTLAAVELVFGLWIYHTARNFAEDEAVGHVARSEGMHDVNYVSFHVGLAAVAGWCVALRGCRLLNSAKILSLAARGMALLVFLAGLFLILQFQSRGISAAVVIALGASLMHGRMKRKTLIVSSLFIGMFLIGMTQTATFDAFVDRWRDTEEVKSGTGRLGLWKVALQQYGDSSLPTKAIGFGYGTELQRTQFQGTVRGSQVSTHNTFLRFLLDQGLTGAALFILALTLCAYGAWRRKDEVGSLGLGMVAFLAIACLSLEPHMSTEFWLALGICLPLAVSAVPLPARAQQAPRPIRLLATTWRPLAGMKTVRPRFQARRNPFLSFRRPQHPRFSSFGFTRKRLRRGFLAPRPPR